jgi:hypothetical protein
MLQTHFVVLAVNTEKIGGLYRGWTQGHDGDA